MGTRGCVAVRLENGGWEGVYNHWDSYPTGLGVDVFREAATALNAGQLHNWCISMLENDDWREFQNDGVCQYCGVRGLGQPHTITLGKNASHQHTRDDGGPVTHITDADGDPLFIEWVYVVDPFKKEIEVLASTEIGSTREYKHESVGTFPILCDFESLAEDVERTGEED